MQLGDQFLRGFENTKFLNDLKVFMLKNKLNCDEDFRNAYKETAIHVSKHAMSLDESEARFSKAVAQGTLNFQFIVFS